MRRYIAVICFLLTLAVTWQCETKEKFRNPLLPSGADPWSIYRDGYYYYTQTSKNKLVLRKTRNLPDLADAPQKTIWQPPPGTMYAEQIWAPELHYIRGSWYMYFAADDGKNENHRIYVLENSSPDPMDGQWTFRGKVSDPSDKWAIDATVFEHGNNLYMLWSGWEGDRDGSQNIYIARMKNPWTIDGERVMISAPTYAWERYGDLDREDGVKHVAVNEGPQVLRNTDRLFVVYSASGCWTPQYSLGLLEVSREGDLLDPDSWTKFSEPVFTQSPEDSVFGPGHNSFFKSPDGREDWILYHANAKPDQGCGKARSPRAQRFFWKADGMPDFGRPVPAGVLLNAPSRDSTTEN